MAASAEPQPEFSRLVPVDRLGEALAQQLAIALDPYPRAPGVALPEAPRAGAGGARAAGGPFAPLESPKRGR